MPRTFPQRTVIYELKWADTEDFRKQPLNVEVIATLLTRSKAGIADMIVGIRTMRVS